MKTILKTLVVMLMMVSNGAYAQKVYYALNSGNWNSVGPSGTWSLNSDAFMPASVPPTADDEVYIIETVNITTADAVAKKVHLENTLIISGGVPHFDALVGHGNMLLYGDYYPEVAHGDYYSGMVALNGTFSMNRSVDNYKNLSFNIQSGTVEFNNSDLKIGTLRITSGNATISENLEIIDDLVVSADCSLTSSSSATLKTNGNIVSSGSLKLAGNLLFASTDRNQTLTLKDEAELAKITVQKGTTNYYADIMAESTGLLKLGDDAIDLQSGTLMIGSNITINALSTNTAFNIPANAELQVVGGTVISSKDINVAGALRVTSGKLQTSNNTINLNGGSFNIEGGQSSVKDVLDNGNASMFSQSAGSIAIEKLLLTSANSTYTTSGGTTTIVRDLTLTCNHAVTGGTIIKDIEGGNFTISVPLYNLTINKGMNFNNSSFEIRGNLTIADGLNIGFNDRDISIAGNLTLGTNASMSNMRSITFNGSRNSEINIPAAFTFPKKMIVDKSGNHSVIINGADVTVTEDLSVLAGNLDANGNAINALSNVTNDGNIVGTLNLNGDTKTISGSGTFDIINQNVATINLDSRITANRYDFAAGKCYLNSYVVTLKEGTNGGPDHYFVNNGDKASAGLRLYVPGQSGVSAGATVATWHIGTDSYYAPAYITAQNDGVTFNAEYITIGAIGKQHPCLKNNTNLNCYWKVETEDENPCDFVLNFVSPSNINGTYTSLALIENTKWVESNVFPVSDYQNVNYCDPIASVTGYRKKNNGKYERITLTNVYQGDDCGQGNYTELFESWGFSYFSMGKFYDTPKTHQALVNTYGINGKIISFSNCSESTHLSSGDYTAGLKSNSTGMRVLYSSKNGNGSNELVTQVWYDKDGNTHTPNAGDILVIKGRDWRQFTNTATVDNIGKIVFEQVPGQIDLGRCMFVNAPNNLTIGEFDGIGMIDIRYNFNSPFNINADYSKFDANDESLYLLYYTGNTNDKTISFSHDGYFPNLTIGHASNNAMRISYAEILRVRNSLNFRRCTFRPIKNVTCGELRVGGVDKGVMEFSPDTPIDFVVIGDITYDYVVDGGADFDESEKTGDWYISVKSDAQERTTHSRLKVGGSILSTSNIDFLKNKKMGLDLVKGQNYVVLEFDGDKNGSVQVNSNRTNFHFNVKQMVINKEPGSYIKLSDVKVNFDDGLAGGETDNKTLVLKSGEVIFDVDGQIVPLSKEGSNNKNYDFVIPEEATLTANKGVTLNVSNCKTGITLAGTLNLNDDAKLVNEGHFYYRLTNKTILNIAKASFESKGDFCPDPATGSGSIRWNITSPNASVKIGGAECGYATSNSQIDIAAGSEINISEGGVINFIGNSTNTTIFNVDIQTDADCKFGPDSDPISTTFVFQNGTFDISSKPSVPHLLMQNAALTLQTLPLKVLGNFTLKNTATLDANGKNILFKGRYFTIEQEDAFTPNGNTVFFSGTNQSVSGSTIKFYNATISNTSGQVEFVYPHIITNELKITEGANLHDTGAGFPITVETKYTNTLGSYTGEGGIELNSGTQNHTIEVFSNGNTSKLIVNNPTNVDVTNFTGQNLVIDNALIIANGLLNMKTTTLTLGKNVNTVETILPGNVVVNDLFNQFDKTKMIVFESAECGIQKIFSGHEPDTIVLPIGVTGKYTPLKIKANTINEDASFTIIPMDNYHPSITENNDPDDKETEVPEWEFDFDLADKDNALKFYWTVESQGAGSFTGALVFKNDIADYKATQKVPGLHYVSARLLSTTKTEWEKGHFDDGTQEGEMDSYERGNIYFTSQQFVFDGDASISGDYTSGLVNHVGVGAIPGDVEVFVSNTDGPWSDPATWQKAKIVDHQIEFEGGDVVADGPAVTAPKSGSIVYVYHNVTAESDGDINVYCTHIGRSSTNEGSVILGTTKSHRLGVVSGTGSIITESGSLPRGRYSNFVKRNTGTIVFDGDSDYDISRSTFNNVVFLGKGQRVLGPDVLIANGYLKADGVSGNDGLKIVNTNGATWNIHGDIIYDGGTFVAPTEGTISTIKMCGDLGQKFVSNKPDNIDRLKINILEMDNSSSEGVVIQVPIDIVQYITFDKGVLNVDDEHGGELCIVDSKEDVDETVKNYDINKFIHGPLTKKILANGSWTFPVGDHLYDSEQVYNRLGHFTVYNYNPGDGSGSGFVTVRYLYKPHDESGNGSKYGPGISSVDRSEYWEVTPSTNGATFGLKLRWDEKSNISNSQSDLANLTITKFEDNIWHLINSAPLATSAHTGIVSSIDSDILHQKDTYVYTLAHTNAYSFKWLGVAGTNWFKPDNWSNGVVPTANDFVVVSSVCNTCVFPIIDEAENETHILPEVKYLSLTDNASLTIKSGSQLTVLTNVVVEDGSTLLLETSSNLKDPDPNNNKVFHSLPVAGSLIYYGNYIGQATFQRFVRSYEFERLSIPVTGFNVSKFKSNAQVDAYDEGLDIDEKDNTTDEYYHYKDANDNNPVILSDGWKVLPNIDNTDITQAYRYICWPWIGNHALSFTGNPVPDGSTDFKIPVSFTLNDPVAPNEGYVDDMLDGWNYIPNPFLSAIDADKIVFNHVDKVIYTHDNISDYPIAYVVDGGFNVGVLNTVGVTNQEGSRYIPAGQSFFVHATKGASTQGSGSVVLTKASRSHGDANMVIKSGRNSGKSEYEKIVFNTSAGGAKYQSAVYFAENATEAFDSQYDAFMQEVEADNVLFFYSFGSDYKVPLAANGLPHSVKDGGEIRLGYSTATAGTYTLYVPTLSVANAQVYLYDAEKETTTQLSEGFACKIDVAAGTNNSRFKLIFEPIVEPEPEPEPEPLPQPQPQPDPINDPVVIINPEIIVPDIIDDSNVPFDVDTDETDNNTDNIVPLPSELTTVDKEIDVKVYPVPSNGPVTVELGSLIEETGSVRMTLVSVSGRVIITKNVVDDKVELNIDKAGVYILRLQTPSKTVVKRVLIQ